MKAPPSLDNLAAGSIGGTSGSRSISLTQLESGDRARFHQADLCCEDCEMLNAMGMTDRCEFKVCKAGGPWIVQVKSTRIGMSHAMAQRIFVIPSTAT